MNMFLLPLIIGFFFDMFLGDPNIFIHPVVIMGKGIEKTEGVIRKIIKNEKIAGMILVFVVVIVVAGSSFFVLRFLRNINFWLGLGAESIMCWQCIAAKGLKKESMKVYYALKNMDIEGARQAVSMIVGRDTETLDEEGMIKATVETVAENTSDGVIAPVFYMVLGGGVLGYVYKAINTIDSMIGYKNEKYINFGWFGAKLDDVANFIPSRLSAVLMIFSAWLLKLDIKNGWKIFKRDRFNHASPNSAQTESVCAGVLNVRLAGTAWYFGERVEKKTIGDNIRDIEKEDIVLANNLMYVSAVSIMVLVMIVYCVGGMYV